MVQVKGSNTERWNTKQNTGSLACNGGSYLDINPNGEVKFKLSKKVTKIDKVFTVDLTLCKGQMKSECIYEIIDFPKYHQKNLIDFCPGRFYRLGTCDLF